MAAERPREGGGAGDASAQFNLGVLYANGTGLRQDAAQVYKWRQPGRRGGVRRRGGALRWRPRHRPTALTPEQIADAERLTREWAASHVRRP